MPRGNVANLVRNENRTPEERRKSAIKAGIASGKARREKADMRKLMQMMLDDKIKDGSITHAMRLTQSILNIAENPKNGAAAVRAYETILHIIGQDEPEPKQESIDLLRQVLDQNRENARVYTKRETT